MIDTHARVQPTRRLLKAEMVVFSRVLGEFPHLQASDSELLTQFAETVIRYEKALKDWKKRPEIETTITQGRQQITKTVPNPARVVVKQAQQAMVSLSRRLLIDAASVDKRMKLLAKKAFANGETVDDYVSDGTYGFTEDQIKAESDALRDIYHKTDDTALRQSALFNLRLMRELMVPSSADDIAALLSVSV